MKIRFKILAFILLIISSLAVILWHNDLKEEEKIEKSNQFKQEFEAFNGELEELNIPENNPMYYASKDEILNILDGTGIIFFGNPRDEKSRTLIPSLISLAKKTNIDRINYYNLYEDRQETKLDETEEEIVIKEQSKFLDKLLETLDIENINDGTVIYVVDGKVLEITEEKDEEQIKKLMLEVSGSACDDLC